MDSILDYLRTATHATPELRVKTTRGLSKSEQRLREHLQIAASILGKSHTATDDLVAQWQTLVVNDLFEIVLFDRFLVLAGKNPAEHARNQSLDWDEPKKNSPFTNQDQKDFSLDARVWHIIESATTTANQAAALNFIDTILDEVIHRAAKFEMEGEGDFRPPPPEFHPEDFLEENPFGKIAPQQIELDRKALGL